MARDERLTPGPDDRMRELVLVALGCLLNHSVTDSAVMGDIATLTALRARSTRALYCFRDRMMPSMKQHDLDHAEGPARR
jgi:hypothetical protein